MKYFDFLPTITYDGEYTVKNLFYKYYFSEPIPNEYLYNYTLQDDETLESMSYEVYGDPVYWWLLAMINDIRDVIFEMPLNSTILQKIATDMSTTGGVLDLIEFSTNYDDLEIENDAKRNIKILKSEYLNNVLTNIIRET